jgi:methionine--tRNA ligase beta chain
MSIISEDFSKLRIRIGLIVSAERVEGTDKLLRLEVDFGDEKRQIVSGIAQFYKPEKLINKEFAFIVNLEPRVIRGIESQGMILAAVVDGKAVLLKPQKKVPPGANIG